MSREAETIPPPEPFIDPLGSDTEPPISPAVLAAIEAAVERATARAFGSFMSQWGQSHVALDGQIQELREMAGNAIRLMTERDRLNTDRHLRTHEDIRALRALLELPEHGSVAELAELSKVSRGAGE